jgi:two-component system, chemotaxis family, protein-glutamate methylesterase/glutaminase
MVEGDRLFVAQGPRENRFRPAINPLFRSAALSFRHRVIGVVLTGMLDDGAAGMWAIDRCGGVCIVQSDAQFDEMPRRAAESVKIDHAVPLNEIAPLLVRLTQTPVEPPKDGEVPELLQLNDDKSKMKTVEIDLDRVGRRSIFSCPECNGALWEVTTGGALQFTCHVGHWYTPQGLDGAQNISIEQSLWSAIRALKENAAMHERLAQRAASHGLEEAATLYRRTAAERTAEAASVQAMLSHRPTAAAG